MKVAQVCTFHFAVISVMFPPLRQGTASAMEAFLESRCDEENFNGTWCLVCNFWCISNMFLYTLVILIILGLGSTCFFLEKQLEGGSELASKVLGYGTMVLGRC